MRTATPEITNNPPRHILESEARRLEADHPGSSVFIHGSTQTEGQLTPTSDIDYTVIATHVPVLRAAGLHPSLSYLSDSYMSTWGRRVSTHVSSPEFRQNYGGYPVAFELRPARNKKKTGVSEYCLPAFSVDSLQQVFIQIQCPKIALNQDHDINVTPQTGYFVVEDQKLIPLHGGAKLPHEFSITSISDSTGSLETQLQQLQGKVIALWGLEAHKALSDRLTDDSDQEVHNRVVKQPVRATLGMIQRFVGSRSIDFTIQLLKTDAELRNNRAGRTKVSLHFIESLRSELAQLTSPALR